MKFKERIYIVYKTCGTVGHFPPIYKAYIKIYHNFPILIIKKFLHFWYTSNAALYLFTKPICQMQIPFIVIISALFLSEYSISSHRINSGRGNPHFFICVTGIQQYHLHIAFFILH